MKMKKQSKKQAATPISLENCSMPKGMNDKGLTPYSLSKGAPGKGGETRPQGYGL